MKYFRDKTTNTICHICKNEELLQSLLAISCGPKRSIVSTEGYNVQKEDESAEASKKPQYAQDIIGILEVMSGKQNEHAQEGIAEKKSKKDFRVQWEAGRIVSKLITKILSRNKRSDEEESSLSALCSPRNIPFVIRGLLTLSVSPFSILTEEALAALTRLHEFSSATFSGFSKLANLDNEEANFVIDSIKQQTDLTDAQKAICPFI